MTASDPRLTRRALLVGAAVAVAGCTAGGSRAQRAPSGPDADALLAAWISEHRLLVAYAESAPQHQLHLAHMRAIEGQLGLTPIMTAAPSPEAPDERATVPVLQGAAGSARVGANAALLASIAASHAVIGAAR